VQNATIPCRSQWLLPLLSVMYFFLPPFSTNYSSILPHLILPSISWSTSQSRPVLRTTQRPVQRYYVTFAKVKRPGHGVDQTPPSSAEVKKEEKYTSTLPWAYMACSKVKLIFLPLTRVIIIIIIRHQLGLDRPVSASSNSLFEDLPSRLRSFDLQFSITLDILFLFTLVTCRCLYDCTF